MKGLKLWEVLKAIEECKKVQYWFEAGKRWITYEYLDCSSLDVDIKSSMVFRIKPEPINVEWITNFDIDEKTSVKHKISYEVDDLGNPIKDTIKVEKI
jgi:hypothetical protein